MPGIPVFTSIPPRFVRIDENEVDIGPAYLATCVKSWRANGFEPISVNAEVEPYSDIFDNLAIRRIDVKRNALEICGKPLVLFEDFIKAALAVSDGPVVITNSDICIDLSSDLLRRIRHICPGQCFVAKRVDIASIDSRQGNEYKSGYDFFVYHTDDLKKIATNPFVFGLPWWDHFLPIAMFLQGVRHIGGEGANVYHLVHAERWDWKIWADFGKIYFNLMISREINDNADFVNRLNRAKGGGDQKVLKMLKIRINRLTAAGRSTDDIQALHRVSRVNEEFIDNNIIL